MKLGREEKMSYEDALEAMKKGVANEARAFRAAEQAFLELWDPEKMQAIWEEAAEALERSMRARFEKLPLHKKIIWKVEDFFMGIYCFIFPGKEKNE